MARRLEVDSVERVKDLEAQVAQAAVQSTAALAELMKKGAGLPTLSHIKFKKIGCDPLDPNRPLNLIEQVNQTFTYLVTLKAVEYLLQKYPAAGPFQLNLGAIGGSDIGSTDGRIAAEVFAATTPGSNNKLNKDVAKVLRTDAELKYVFYYSEDPRRVRKFEGVEVVSIELE